MRSAVDDARVAASRTPLDAAEIASRAVSAASWSIRTVAETGSTNDDLVAAAASGAADGTVLIAELQTAGRGRRQRTWTAPPGAGLTMSVLLAVPEVPPAKLGWIGLLGGVALASAVSRVAAVPAALKWPNDLLVGGGKCAGILAAGCPDGRVVLGMGMNVSLQRDELPRADATSLLLAGARTVDRTELAAAILDELAERVRRWRSAAGDPVRSGLRADYLEHCATVGRSVRAELPGGGALVGRAVGVDADGALVVDGPSGRRSLAAADVHHLRPAEPAATGAP